MTMSRVRTTIGFFVLASFCVSAVAATSEHLETNEWLSDLDYLVNAIETVHPDPYGKIDRDSFEKLVDSVAASVPELSDEEIALEFMQLVAAIGDGHSSIEPTGLAKFGRSYPVRFYRFTDGIFITAIGEQYSEFAGAELLRIGSLDAEIAWDAAGALIGSDNKFGFDARAPFYLSNATVLQLLGASSSDEKITLAVRRRGEETPEQLELAAIEDDFDLSFQYWGEIWGPAWEKANYVTAFDGRSSDDFYNTSSDLPLHLRYRSAYWYNIDPDTRTAFIQINYMVGVDRDDVSFSDFVKTALDSAASSKVDTVIIDLRYDVGGNGGLVNDLVHALIRYEASNPDTRLFALVGRATFSAGVMLAHGLDEHTSATFVGEPAGAYYKHLGDATTFVLPNSGLTVNLSTVYHQMSAYVDEYSLMPIAIPAQFSSEDYFSGRDPAIEKILDANQAPLSQIFRSDGAGAGIAEYERIKGMLGDLPWWQPIGLEETAQIADEFASNERWQDALLTQQLNSHRFPDDWSVWHNLAELQEKMGQVDEAAISYKKALDVDPFNNLASVQRSKIEDLQVASSE